MSAAQAGTLANLESLTFINVHATLGHIDNQYVALSYRLLVNLPEQIKINFGVTAALIDSGDDANVVLVQTAAKYEGVNLMSQRRGNVAVHKLSHEAQRDVVVSAVPDHVV